MQAVMSEYLFTRKHGKPVPDIRVRWCNASEVQKHVSNTSH